MVRRIVALVLTLSAALVVAAPASVSLRDDIRAGERLAQQLQAGKTTCDRLVTDGFERLGEYMMSRMAGSTPLHVAMNERMRSVMGSNNTERMHTLMGQRYAGSAVTGNAGPVMGPGMMGRGGWSDGSTWGPMMSSRDWDWMRDGNWQHMSRSDWQRLGDQWMGPGMMRAADSGWHTREYIFVGLAIVLAAGLLVALLAWRPSRRGHRGLGTH